MNRIKFAVFAMGTVFFGLSASMQASAAFIDVFQAGKLIGSLEAYSGKMSAADNWKQNHGPNIGPAGETDVGKLFFYQSDIDGLTFNTLWNRHDSNDKTPSRVDWDIKVTGTDSYQIVADDVTDMEQISDNHYSGQWAWGPVADGGVIGGLTGDWQITIDPRKYIDVDALFAYGSDNFFSLDIDLEQSLVFKAAEVAEPGTMALVALSLFAVYRVRKNKRDMMVVC